MMTASSNRLFITIVLFALLVPSAAWAQDKLITRSHMVGIGGSNILDTYLSNEQFKGIGFSFVATIERQRPEHHWSTLMEHEANLSNGKDRANNQHELEGAYNFYWGKLYSWQLMDRLAESSTHRWDSSTTLTTTTILHKPVYTST